MAPTIPPFLLFTFILKLLYSHSSHGWTIKEDTAGLEFCEDDKYFHVSQKQCPVGMTFGPISPDCICIKGIYRAFMDNCEISDGFARDVCMLPYEKQPGVAAENSTRLHSIQILADPDWDKSHLVIETVENAGNWTIFTHGEEELGNNHTITTINSTAEEFYVINGEVWIAQIRSVNLPQRICFEPMEDLLGGAKVCKITKRANSEIWMTQTLEIVIRDSKRCLDEVGGVEDARRLYGQFCVAPLGPRDDECETSCVRKGIKDEGLLPNCTLLNSIYYENEFLERQLDQHALLTQQNAPNSVGEQQPNRTLELFKLMVETTTRFCPDAFVPTNWINFMVDLFYSLHKGNEFKFVEFLSDDEYQVTRGILEDCLSKGYKVNLTNRLKDTPIDVMCPMNEVGGPAVGYCMATDEGCTDPIRIDPIRNKMRDKLIEKHYVPEVAWSIIDATQAICLREFISSYRMFHLLQQATEKLFTTHIRDLWHYPPARSQAVRNRLLGKGAEEHLQNLEICTGAAYHITNSEHKAKYGTGATMIHRLFRPPVKSRMPRRRSSTTSHQPPINDSISMGDITQVYCNFSEPQVCLDRQTNILQRMECSSSSECTPCKGKNGNPDTDAICTNKVCSCPRI